MKGGQRAGIVREGPPQPHATVVKGGQRVGIVREGPPKPHATGMKDGQRPDIIRESPSNKKTAKPAKQAGLDRINNLSNSCDYRIPSSKMTRDGAASMPTNFKGAATMKYSPADTSFRRRPSMTMMSLENKVLWVG